MHAQPLAGSTVLSDLFIGLAVGLFWIVVVALVSAWVRIARLSNELEAAKQKLTELIERGL